VLLPSEEVRVLSERVDICLSGRAVPLGCDIRFRQFYWLMVFSSKGEILAAYRLADQLSKQKKLGSSLPQGLVNVVDAGLKTKFSLEQLERRYISERGSARAYEALKDKVSQMERVGQMRVGKFLAKVAHETADPGLSRARGILMVSDACDHQVINHAAYANLKKLIEGFIHDYPQHPSCLDLIEPLANVALKYSFDLRSRCAVYAKAWSAMPSKNEPARKGLKNLAQKLRDHCDAEVERTKKKLSGMKPGAYGVLRSLARLGRAKETLEGLEKAKTFGVMRPIHAEWRVDAKAKKSREK
jgi:hypothetical protein